MPRKGCDFADNSEITAFSVQSAIRAFFTAPFYLFYRFSQHFTDYPKLIDLFENKCIIEFDKGDRGKQNIYSKKQLRYDPIKRRKEKNEKT